MANCLLNDDLLKSNLCGYSLGEIARIYLANYEDVKATTLDTSGGTAVDTITMASGATFYKIDPAKNSANWTDELVVADSGAKYRTHTLNFNVIGSYTLIIINTVFFDLFNNIKLNIIRNTKF